MPDDWLILHGGAVGDLVLTLQLALRLPGVSETGMLRVISRIDPGGLSTCRPSILRQSSEGLGLHWLFGDHDDPPPERLRASLHRKQVLGALGGVHTIQHHRLAALEPAALYSIDPRPHAGANRHITEQWQTQLEAQGLLLPKCIHQRPNQRGLGVPDALQRRGARLLDEVQASRATILIHPGSGGRSKCWPVPCFIETARRVRREHSAAVCFLIGPVELETWPPAELTALGDEFPILRAPAPDDLVALLAAAHLFIGNDAGPAHLAALLGTPTMVLFGPTPTSVWRPLGPRVRVLTGDPQGHTRDWGITPEHVAASAAEEVSVPAS